MSRRTVGGVTPRPPAISKRIPTAAAVATAVLLLFAASSAAAHDGGPRLALEPSQVNPGGVVVVRGEDLGRDEEMEVTLVGDAGRAGLVSVTTDGQGHFSAAAQIPADVPVGTYALQVVTSTGATVKTLVRVAGVPVVEDDDGALPGQDEGFPALAPASSEAPAVEPVIPAAASTAPAASAGVALRPLSDPTGTAGEVDLVPFVALAGAIGALGLLVWRTRRSAASQTRSADMP